MSYIRTFCVNSLRECMYVLSSENRGCVIVDPGCQNGHERARVDEYIETAGLKPECVLLTHAHFDHVLSVAHFALKWNIPAVMNYADLGLLTRLPAYAQLFGLEYMPMDGVEFRYVSDGELLDYGGFSFRVITTPGHTAGGVCYLEEEEKLVFTGDTLFQNNIGRTDFEESSEEDMFDSLKKLKRLDPQTEVFPGHGESTTIADELKHNPFMR